MKWTVIVFFIGLVVPSLAQHSNYCVNVSHFKTLTTMGSVPVKVTKHGITQYITQTNFDGRVYFPNEMALDSNNIISFNLVGFKTEEIRMSRLEAGKEFLLHMKPCPVELEEFRVEAYKIPIIKKKPKKKRWWQRKKRKTVAVRDSLVYSAEELAAFEKLKGEGWDLTDSTAMKGRAGEEQMKQYYAKTFFYPTKAVKYELEEKLVFVLLMNKKADKTRLKLLQGKNPALAMEAARVIVHSPGWIFEEPILNNLEIHLPVNFVLK